MPRWFQYESDSRLVHYPWSTCRRDHVVKLLASLFLLKGIAMSDQRATELHAPHQTIVAADKREAFTIKLFDRLWEIYLSRVTYVQQYEKLVRSLQATFFNDHIAFRTIAAQNPCVGIATLGRIFEALGYQAASAYQFPDKNLSSIHFQHVNPKFPKLFITELRSWNFRPNAE